MFICYSSFVDATLSNHYALESDAGATLCPAFLCLIVDRSQDGFRLKGDFRLRRGQLVELVLDYEAVADHHARDHITEVLIKKVIYPAENVRVG